MADHILPGDPPIALRMRRSARARRISLRVSQLDGRVTLTLPCNLPEAEALDFAHQKEGWLRDHLARRPDPCLVGPGAVLPIEGVPCRVVSGGGRRVSLGAGEIVVPAGREAARLQAFLKLMARERLAQAADDFAGRLGRSYARLSLRDTRSRWGSCTSDGGLMFSWRLILAPPPVLTYVAAHEVAHLVEMNHSPAFWKLVAALDTGYAAPRRWLRDHGAELHRYRFAAGA